MTPRIFAPRGALTDAQRTLIDAVSNGPFGPHGPRMILAHSPAVSLAWNGLGSALQECGLPSSYAKLGILVIARHWRAQFAWDAHAPTSGLEADVVEDIRLGVWPKLTADQEIIFQYCVELVVDRRVSDEAYAAARELLGDRGLVEFTVHLGHYTNVAMTLSAHEAPLPGGRPNPLPALTEPPFTR